MNVIIDTHVLLWWLGDDPALPPRSRQLLADPRTTVFLSAVVMWELRIKQALGKIALPPEFREALAAQGFTELPVTIAHTDQLATLPMLHRDPFDRLLVAQATAENLTLMSFDQEIRLYEVALAPA